MNPNFFIIGAPKSGTTALSEYLRTHPEVFISEDKEPNYWNDDYKNISTVGDYDEYMALFHGAEKGHRAVGEASVNYLSSSRAVPRILEVWPDTRFVALLRNPVDLAFSWHSQMLFGLYEDEEEFEVAWSLQESRRRGERIPSTCVEPRVLDYHEVAAIGTHVERLFANAPREQIQIHLFDDFKDDAGAVYRDTLAFLGVADDGRSDFPVINENKTHRYKLLARFVERPPAIWVSSARVARRMLGLERVGLLQRLRDSNKVATKRPTLRPEFRAQLVEEFRSEIEKTSELLGRDLSSWLAVEATSADAAPMER